MSTDNTQNISKPSAESPPDIDLIGESLARAGKTEGEIEAVKILDQAQVHADSQRAKPGVIQQALLGNELDLALFACMADKNELIDSKASLVLSESLATSFKYGDNIIGADGKVNPDLINDLAKAGYWGLPIPQKWGGAGASKFFCGRAIVTMGSSVGEIIGGLLSIERLIGAAGPLIWKGTDEQRERLLRPLAEGYVRSGFGGTEPSVGCNITKASTYGVIEGDEVVVYGEKLFISNAWYGHQIALLLQIDNKLRVLITDLPEADSEQFSIVNYGIHALRHIHNKGIKFNGLRVPLANLLDGDGLAIIFHDLDEGRFAVAATAAARIRRILSSCVPWVHFRETFGEKLYTRQYIQYLMALQAAYLVGSETLVDWSASLIDNGYQGDVSSMIAKTKATDWLRQCATELGMFTHGGRFVLDGHTIGDNLADDMVSSVYEGPNPMLGKACVKSMAKAFIEVYFKPLMVEMVKAELDIGTLMRGNLKSAGHVMSKLGKIWKNRKGLTAATSKLIGYVINVSLKAPPVKNGKNLNGDFADHLKFARKAWFKWRRNFVLNVLKYQDKLADEDLLMLEDFYEPMANISTMLCAINASRDAIAAGDEATLNALNMLCLEMRVKLAGEKRTSRRYRKAVKETAGLVVSGQMRQLDHVPHGTILREY